MALDPPVTYGLPAANLVAARQHVQTLSARDREALLRALLEQYEHPSDPPRSRSEHSAKNDLPAIPLKTDDEPAVSPVLPARSASTTSISVTNASLFDCPSLPEEANEESVAIVPAAVSSGSSSVSSDRQTAPSPTPVSRFRSQSLSQPLLSSFSITRLEQSKAHSRSRSLSSPDVAHPAAGINARHVVPSINTSASASTATTAINKPPSSPSSTTRAYWCTACGEKLFCRSTWALHDNICRSAERRLAGTAGESSRETGGHNQRRHQQHAWACGFCAAFLGSLERYHDHVAAHFERGKTLAHWHYANIIYGLLHQPVVHNAWKQLWAARAAALPPHLRPKATWSPGCASTKTTDSAGFHASLQEVLEFFDPALDSAAALALQADALAIYISVPIEDDAHQIQALVHGPPGHANDASAPPPIQASAPATKQPKDGPLPALPSSSLPDATKKDGKRNSKPSPRKSLSLFRSKSPSSSSESMTREAARSVAKLSKPRPLAPTSKSVPTSIPAPIPVPNTATSPRRNNWADRPLPPLILDDAEHAPSVSPPTYARMTSGYTVARPPSPPPKTQRRTCDATGDWNSIATTIVDDIMAPVDALHIAV